LQQLGEGWSFTTTRNPCAIRRLNIRKYKYKRTSLMVGCIPQMDYQTVEWHCIKFTDRPTNITQILWESYHCSPWICNSSTNAQPWGHWITEHTGGIGPPRQKLTTPPNSTSSKSSALIAYIPFVLHYHPACSLQHGEWQHQTTHKSKFSSMGAWRVVSQVDPS
jgi:hypothetical protein